jgi:hypothetical protein
LPGRGQKHGRRKSHGERQGDELALCRLDFHTGTPLYFLKPAGIAIDGAHAYFPILDGASRIAAVFPLVNV